MSAAGSRAADVITVAELARRRRCDKSTVRRWLLELEERHGGVVFRRGKGTNARVYTTTAALARVAPDMVEPESDVRAAIADVRAALAELQTDVDRLNARTTTLLARLRDVATRLASLERSRA
jgi:hypothetical protein